MERLGHITPHTATSLADPLAVTGVGSRAGMVAAAEDDRNIGGGADMCGQGSWVVGAMVGRLVPLSISTVGGG